MGLDDVTVDLTRSTNRAMIRPALGVIRQNLADLISRPECGRQLIVRSLMRQSYGSDNALLSAYVPAISALGPRPVKGPFEATSHYKARVAAYQKEKAHIRMQRAAAARAVSNIDSRLAHLRFPYEKVASDVTGPFVAFSRFAKSITGPKSLIVLSDFLPAGRQSSGRLDMSGTRVVLVQRCDGRPETSSQCQSIPGAWQARLKKAHAKSVATFDVAQYQFVRNAF
jgi:hypothetical protein